jgi:hypothetical protein
MNRTILLLALAVADCACASPRVVEANRDYRQDLRGCVDSARTHDAGLACVDRVDQAWGLRDGGGQ